MEKRQFLIVFVQKEISLKMSSSNAKLACLNAQLVKMIKNVYSVKAYT